MLYVPSGAVYYSMDLAIVRRMHEVGFVEWTEKPFTLKSGIKSNVYIHGRGDLTKNPDLERKLGRKLAEVVYDNAKENVAAFRPQCLIGVPIGGNVLAQAAAMSSVEPNISVTGFPPIYHLVMRQQKKDHGANQKWIDGDPNPDHSNWLLENVTTSGISIMEAAGRAAEDGFPARMRCLVLIDRQQGAVPRLQREGFDVVVVYNLLDITYVFAKLKLWPRSTNAAVEAEIKAHQFKQE